MVLKKKNWKFKLGLGLILFSIPLFLSLPFIPFLSLDNKTKITLTTIVFITAEVTFYSGGFFLGKELFIKYKDKLNPKNWFKRRTKQTDDKIN